MTKFQVAYVPVGVPTFHLESAQKEFEKSIDLLKMVDVDLESKETYCNTIEFYKKYIDELKKCYDL